MKKLIIYFVAMLMYLTINALAQTPALNYSKQYAYGYDAVYSGDWRFIPYTTYMQFMRLMPGTAPLNPEPGTIYYDIYDNKLKCWNGTIWDNL